MSGFLGSSLPNLHPALVHLPIALLPSAAGLDVAGLILGRKPWLSRAAEVLYVAGALGAGAAYWAGEEAADSVVGVNAAGRAAMGTHADWALYTLWAYGIIVVLRLVSAWWRPERWPRAGRALRVVSTAGAILALGLLLETADLGGSLVYRHGVGVGVGVGVGGERSSPGAEGAPPSAEEARKDRAEVDPRVEPGAFPAPSEPSRPVHHEDGSIEWRPRPTDLTAIGTILVPVEGSWRGAVTPAGPGSAQEGLAIDVEGKALLVLPGEYSDVQVEAILGVEGFTGSAGIAHHVTGAGTGGVFSIEPDGKLSLASFHGAERTSLASGRAEFRKEKVALTVSAAGRHLMGLVDGKTVAHGHAPAGPPGGAGLLLDGHGVVRIVSMKIVPTGKAH